ncbi:DUF2254 domain-containing protein [Pontibacter anaerobius]|uniref:DUF2254 domain-containing protein n=1 Tax=Pontibacter anaerobius TaxID=2993940 RepID=A0ABT3RBV2_9BACT|nr:DUF2254 domain-containing protein [Pontibacter anaerobius]MCX2739346.1 DUF2254 domain-containing protein [Pontibacter anaerobius]
MNRILSRIKFVYQYIISSIGFLPTLISLGFFVLALLVLYLETVGLSQTLKENLPFMIITNGETARLVLSTIATGIISLTVFSFTMVMLVLNQASSNFSPRVIPGIITYKSNQSVTGLYLGTLIYTLVVMVNVRSEFYSVALPGFAIFLAMGFAIACLGFFVYFIHSISESIQIDSILEGIYHVTKRQLEEEIERDKGAAVPNVFTQGEWTYLKSPNTGYLQSLDEDAVIPILQEFDVVLDFEQPLGSFLVEGVPFARVNKKLDDLDKFTDRLFDHVYFYREERPGINYIFGFKHITESAVKALSPGINDPGTALKATDYLTALFALRMQLTDEKVIYDEDGAGRIRFKHDTFEDIFSLNLSPLRLYGKSDIIVVLKLLMLMEALLYKVKPYAHLKPVLYSEAMLLLHDADESIKNPGDRQKINHLLNKLNEMHQLDRLLPLLTISH